MRMKDNKALRLLIVIPTLLDAASAVRYFKAELPLFMNSAEIVGVTASVFVYQQCPSFLERLFLEGRGDIISPQQGFVKLNAD